MITHGSSLILLSFRHQTRSYNVIKTTVSGGLPAKKKKISHRRDILRYLQKEYLLISVPVPPAVAGQRPGAVQELPPGHIRALAAGGGGDGLRGGQLGHG